MANTQNVLAISATIDRSPLGSGWQGTGSVNPDQPLGAAVNGLFAFGDNVTTARQNLARIVFAALPASVRSEVTDIRIFAITRKTFSVADLADNEPNLNG